MLTSLRSTLPRRAVAARSITSAARLQSASVHGNDPQVLEKEKQKNLANKQHETSSPHKDAPGWNEYLASDSEANIKADQSKNGSPSDLTQRTIEFVKKRDKETSSSSETYTPKSGVAGGGDHEHAHYAREEIEGPLANKGQQSKAERDEVQGPLARH